MGLGRVFTAFAAAVVLAGCSNNAELNEVVDLGEFRLGHNVVEADFARQGPLSRSATAAELETAMQNEMTRRFSRYDGSQLYHIRVDIDGYVLAAPGIPVVAAPKSLMIFSVRIWDDDLAAQLTDEARQFTVFESLSGDLVLGSGFTMSSEEQLQNLVENAAAQIESYLGNNPQWFVARPGAATDAMRPPEPEELPAEAEPATEPAL